MPDNRQVQKNAGVSIQSGSNIEDTFWRLKINDNQEVNDAAQLGPYPDRPGEPDCLHYVRTGICRYGNNCRYNHPVYVSAGVQYNGELPERVGQPDCEYFLKTGTCKYGSSCKYHHPRDRRGAGPVTFNIIGLPMRQEEKPCPFYMRTGACKFGVACKFHHPQPASFGTMLPGAAAFGSTGFMPSSGVPYLGGAPSWSLPRGPYMTGSNLQGQQSYMPVLLSPSQGAIPTQGWNTYMGNLSPLPSPSVLGPNFIYNSKNLLGVSGSSRQGNLLSTSNLSLPQRPDQPECRFFINNGTCKYGSDCKFHHPKDRMPQAMTNALGLPSRPGQAVCSYYSVYGLCKYGPNCKFDHPFLIHPPYNYGLGIPALSMLDSSLSYHPTVPISATLPKSSEWIENPNSMTNHQNSNTKYPEEDPIEEEATTSPSPSLPAASESSLDHSP